MGEGYVDPRTLTVEQRLRRGARYAVGYAIMDDRDPNILFNKENIDATVANILGLAQVRNELTPELNRQLLRVVADELAPVYEELGRRGIV